MDNQINDVDLETTPVEDDTLILFVPEYCWNNEQVERISLMFEREGFDNFRIQPRSVLDNQNIKQTFSKLDPIDEEVKYDEA